MFPVSPFYRFFVSFLISSVFVLTFTVSSIIAQHDCLSLASIVFTAQCTLVQSTVLRYVDSFFWTSQFFERPFVKRSALCYQSVVCLFVCLSVLSCLSVCDVGALWPNGYMDQDETWHGCRPRPRPHCVTCGPRFPPQSGTAHNFRPMSVVAKRLAVSRCHLVWR